jgi:hypothetical protein
MRFAKLVSVALLLGAADAGLLFRENKPVYEDWSLEQTRDFLLAQGIKVKDSDTVQDLQKQAAKHADAASTWAAEQASYASIYATDAGAYAAARASAAVKDVNAQVVDTWDESQLREWLLEQGIISPASKPEQLRILAKNKVSRLSSAVFGGPADTAKASGASAASEASKTAASAASEASKSAESVAAWGQKSAESVASWGTKSVNSLASEGASHASTAAVSAYNWASGKLDDTRANDSG